MSEKTYQAKPEISELEKEKEKLIEKISEHERENEALYKRLEAVERENKRLVMCVLSGSSNDE